MFNTDQFFYDKQNKVLVGQMIELGLLNQAFPGRIRIKSLHTGRIIEFVQDTEAFLMNEGWDGELMEYVPDVPAINVKKLVLIYSLGE